MRQVKEDTGRKVHDHFSLINKAVQSSETLLLAEKFPILALKMRKNALFITYSVNNYVPPQTGFKTNIDNHSKGS